jgi:hypothetical protein
MRFAGRVNAALYRWHPGRRGMLATHSARQSFSSERMSVISWRSACD